MAIQPALDQFRLLFRAALPLAAALCVGALPSSAQIPPLAEAPAAADYAEAIDGGRALLLEVMEASSIPGLSVAVLVDGRVEWSEGLGYADLENRVPATRLTRFRIGSVSKPVAAAAVGLLVQQGRLDLDVPVQRYVPEFPQKEWPITTRQAAGHIAGIRHYRGDEFLLDRAFADVDESLTIFQDDSLLFEPGTDYGYSTYGWTVVSAVVEGAAGEPFLGYMRSAVFGPLGLRSIVAEHNDSIIAYRASFYHLADDGRVMNAPHVDNSYKWAGGGFVSNTEDLVRFGWAHLEGSLLEPGTVETLFTPLRTSDGETTDYGIGWRSGEDDAGRAWRGHTGSSVGGRAVLLIYPNQRVVVAVLANLSSAPMSTELAAELAAGFIAAAEGGTP